MKGIRLPLWTILFPILGILLLMFAGSWPGVFMNILMGVVLVGVILAAVHHAEVVAHRVGEPFGTIILAVAITIIEVSLIVSIMISEGEAAASLARDTVFAAVMIIMTGMVGLCLLVGGYRYREQVFVKEGVSAALIVLTAISALTLILPNYTTSVAGPYYNKTQLIFVAIVSFVLYSAFIGMQTIRHRDYFLPASDSEDEDTHADPPTVRTTLISLAFLMAALVAVVMLSKKLSPVLETFVSNVGAPRSLVGVLIALVILLPEGMAAIRAARKNRLQTSLNLALGSALACIGLTIPCVAIVSLVMGFPITLGIDTKSMLLFLTSLLVLKLFLGAGRSNVLQGVVLLVLLATYFFITIVP